MIKEIELKKLGRNLAAVLILGQLLSASGLYAQVDFARTQDFGAMQATAMEEDKFIFIDGAIIVHMQKGKDFVGSLRSCHLCIYFNF